MAIFMIAEYDQYGIGRCACFLDGTEISEAEYWAVQMAAVYRVLNGDDAGA